MTSPAYTYNLDDKKISDWNQNFTSRIGDGSGDPEAEYLSLLHLIANCRPEAKYLDIGCGEGRVIDIVQHCIGSLVGLEPDPKRFQACYKTHNDGHRIRIINSTSAEYRDANPSDRFDIIALSMVLQHVPTGVCDQILQDVRALLMPEGVAIIATTQRKVEQFTFALNSTPRTVEEFDRYAADTANQPYGLPVRNFSKDSFRQAIERAGLDIIHWGQFSYVRPEKLGWVAAQLGLSPEAIEDVATSQHAVVKRSRT
jgi:SAM-dependent methyltransferase